MSMLVGLISPGSPAQKVASEALVDSFMALTESSGEGALVFLLVLARRKSAEGPPSHDRGNLLRL